MKFTAFVAAFAAFASSVMAQSNPITSPSGGSIQAGQPTTITWQPSDSGTITLVLRSGSSGALNTVATIASNIPNTGSYSWTPDSSIPSASDYTIQITSSANPSSPNFSPRFAVTGGSASASGSSASGSSTGSITASASGSSTTSLPTLTPLSNSTVTTSTTSTTSSNSTTTKTSKSSSSSSSSSSKSSSTATSTSSGGSSAPSSGASMVKRSDCGIAAAVLGLAGLVAMI